MPAQSPALCTLVEVLPLTQPEHLGLEGGAVAAGSGRCFSPGCDARGCWDRTLSSNALQMNFPNKVVKPDKSCVAESTANLNGLHLIWLISAMLENNYFHVEV